MANQIACRAKYYPLIPKELSCSAHLGAGFSTGTETWRASPFANVIARTSAKWCSSKTFNVPQQR